MNQVPKVSVVIPVYNVENYLRECLDSVVGQTLKEIEIICVNDCSTDGSYNILQEYHKKDSRVVLVQHPKNKGPSTTRNSGANYATGEFLYFLDSDDVLDLTALEKLWKKATAEELDCLFLESEMFFHSIEVEENFSFPHWNYAFFQESQGICTGREFFVQYVKQYLYFTNVWLLFFNRSYYLENRLKFVDGLAYAEDIVFSFENMMKAKRVNYIHEILHHYRVRENSFTTARKAKPFFFSFLRCYLFLLQISSKESIQAEEQDFFDFYFSTIQCQATEYYGDIQKENIEQKKISLQTATEQKIKQQETLYNLHALLENQPLVSCVSVSELKKSTNPLLFFGAGREGEKAMALFQAENIPLPLAICDNNPTLQGTFWQGLSVFSLEEALKRYPECSFLVTNKKYQKEIIAQISPFVANILLLGEQEEERE